jgi:hypothetical protein
VNRDRADGCEQQHVAGAANPNSHTLCSSDPAMPVAAPARIQYADDRSVRRRRITAAPNATNANASGIATSAPPSAAICRY